MLSNKEDIYYLVNNILPTENCTRSTSLDNVTGAFNSLIHVRRTNIILREKPLKSYPLYLAQECIRT